MNCIFPRPRDLIYFFKSCKDTAVSRGHEMIQKSDILQAYKEYSSWVFKALLVENNFAVKQMEDFLYELVGNNEIITEEIIVNAMKNAGLPILTEEDIEKFIDHLVDLTIFGREVKEGVFEYEYDVDNFKKIKLLAQKLNTKRYKIHNALVPYLECIK